MVIHFSPYSFKSWWDIIRHLIWSLLGLADSDKLGSTDQTSLILLWLLYALFLVMVVILLVNMLIAVLSNVYQGVEVTIITEFNLFHHDYSSFHKLSEVFLKTTFLHYPFAHLSSL